MIKEVSTNDTAVQQLIHYLDTYQIGLYGVECCHLDSPEELANQDAYMLGAYLDGELVGIGAIKLLDGYAEIKRMYFLERARGTPLARQLFRQLERYAIKRGYQSILLETGVHQLAAVSFYKKHGYTTHSAFGDYEANNVSVFMGKRVDSESELRTDQ